MRPALPERTDAVVHAVASPLKRQSRALRRGDLHIGERLEEVAVAQVHVWTQTMSLISPTGFMYNTPKGVMK